ncbi:DUF2510 domain-containing protein [Streptomyces sp. NPDC058319]|uniref:DUF2510 domain-containing protein n=1 Tax=unclassified Streptomyces TaxID=2593676 RepID=UPI0007DD19D9|nr:DUF2510 domain-containing protein [Streptomyces sp. SAT1]ANH90703.1 hypothetical protein A8713_05660 [Streptomyces sp. SAT1]
MTPPPGWYRDPSAPHLERWWDGTAWSEHRRSPETVPLPLVVPAARRPARARAVALAAAGSVLAAAIVTGAVLLHDGGDGGDRGDGATSTAPGGPAATDTATAPAAPPDSSGPSGRAGPSDASVVVDQLNGITLPLPAGWEAPQNVSQDDVVMTTHGVYDCPAGRGLCRHGLVSTLTPASSDGARPETLARNDIADAADAAYGRNAAGDTPYDGITAHQDVAAGQVAVAGRAGYFVRRRVRTAKGPGGYVESLAFSSSTGVGAPVIVRFVLDAGPDGPPLADIDRITKGIRPIGATGADGGVGSSIGPSSG